MIKKIVEEFGGSIDIKSRVGAGTVVTLLLPPMLAVRAEPSQRPDRPLKKPRWPRCSKKRTSSRSGDTLPAVRFHPTPVLCCLRC